MFVSLRDLSITLLALLLGLIPLQAKEYQLKADLDPLFLLPEAYKKTPEDLPKIFEQGGFDKNPYFQWLTQSKDRVIFKRKPSMNVTVDLSILNGEVPIEEAVVDFIDGKFAGITISIFNTGDGGKISRGEFEKRKKAVGSYLSTILKTKPRERKGNIKKGAMTSGYTWSSPRGKAVLEYNNEAPQKIEFFRLRLSPKKTKGIYAAAMQDRSIATVRKSQLANFVKKDGDDVWIPNVPMVDQGTKGYCVVASAQRLFEYYGISCDMHQLAQLANSDPEMGTNTVEINKQLGEIDYLFKTRFTCQCIKHNGRFHELKDGRYVGDPVPDRQFYKIIYDNIDDGIPILWSLQLGKFPEEPNLNRQTSGGHMRMIIGYNKAKNRIIFTDSWGAGHEKKTMDADDARKATSGIFLMKPTVN